MSELKIVVGEGGDHRRTLVDRGSGVAIEFSYRLPTNQERLAYQRDAFRRGRKRIVIRTEAAALEHVQPLLDGFKFPYADEEPASTIRWEDPEGSLVVLSCRPGDPGYREDWRDILRQAVPHMLAVLGAQIFGGVSEDAGMEVVRGLDLDEAEESTDPNS